MPGSLGITGIAGYYWGHWGLLGSLGVTGGSGSTEDAQGLTGITGNYWDHCRSLGALRMHRGLLGSLGVTGSAGGGQEMLGNRTGEGLGTLRKDWESCRVELGALGSAARGSLGTLGVTGNTERYWESTEGYWECWEDTGGITGSALGPTAGWPWVLVALGQCPQCPLMSPHVPSVPPCLLAVSWGICQAVTREKKGGILPPLQ